MVPFIRRFFVLIIGIVLLATPTVIREQFWQYNERSYTPPEVPELSLAATPVPTPTAMPLVEPQVNRESELRSGPVLLDLAHFNSIDPSALQPLADALANRGLGLKYWLSTIDPMSVVNYLEYPDQSEVLVSELRDASAMIIISPFFLWTPPEIRLLEQFVADGGRLLLISDPDIFGDFVPAANMIGEPFGVVFNADYLYDTSRNDGNYTFFFQEEASAADQASTSEPQNSLADSTIAFYGGRSLSGDLQPVLQSVETTLSSLRVGRSGFATAGIAGLAERNTAGRVLALTDLDVLTEPYRQRHDNQQLVDYVADFLSGDERVNRVVDFPNYLGKEVALTFGASRAINANLILQGAEIQNALEASGRTLTLTDSSLLTNTTDIETTDIETTDIDAIAPLDTIYLADYTTAMSQTTLLRDLNIELYREVVTETVPIEPTTSEPVAPAAEIPVDDPMREDPVPPEESPTATVEPENGEEGSEGDGDGIVPLPTVTPAPTLTTTTPFTATVPVTPTDEVDIEERFNTQADPEPAPTATPPVSSMTVTITETEGLTVAVTLTEPVAMMEPEFEERTIITTYLRMASGLTFLAEETVLVVRTQNAAGADLLAVLAANNRGIDTGVSRLLTNDFSGCVIGDIVTFCALEPTGSGSTDGSDSPSPTTEEGTSDEGEPVEPSPSTPAPPRGLDAPVLLIDDNSVAAPDELSEADIYLQMLLASGYLVDLWSVADQGEPTAADFANYGWVIWSNAGYAAGTIDGSDLETIFTYISENGRLTISSRAPLPGLETTAPLSDLIVENTVPALVNGLPTTPIPVTGDETTSAVFDATTEGDETTQIILRRGPASESADAPALVVLTDPSTGESEARLMLVAFAMGWLPESEQGILINNMAFWMLSE